MMTEKTCFGIGGLLLVTSSLCGSAFGDLAGPYTADGNTLHLWHFDEAVPGPVTPDSGVTGSFNLVPSNGAFLGAMGFAGFGMVGDLTAGTPAGFEGGAISVSEVTGVNGSFTFEAMIRTSEISAIQQIISMENSGGANVRPFQFRIASGALVFINITGCLLYTSPSPRD